MNFHTVVSVHVLDDVVQAGRIASALAASLKLDEDATSRAVTVATDLGAYLNVQPTGGRLLVSTVEAEDGSPLVEFVAVSEDDAKGGVGAANHAGDATRRISGGVLDLVRQHSCVFDTYAVPGIGAVVLSQVGAASLGTQPPELKPAVFGGICVPVAGETVSGDAWSVVTDGARVSVLLADGLGHGPEAADASTAAVQTFLSDPFTTPSRLLAKAHMALRSTRGAAVAMAHADFSTGSMTFCGAGNVAGRLISGVEDRGIISQPGTVGVGIRTLKDVHYDWPAHALLILHSDGIVSRWDFDDAPGLIRHHPTLIAGWLLLTQSRGRDDATAVVIRRRNL